MQPSKTRLGDLQTFHKNLEKKAALVLSETCHHSTIQKQWEAIVESDASVRLIAPREFIHRQLDAGWQASTQMMDCWFQENREDLKRTFNQEFIGFQAGRGLKALPPKNLLLAESDAIEQVVNDGLAFSRTITAEVQKVMADLKEELQRKKEAANQEFRQADRDGFGLDEASGVFVEEGHEDLDQPDEEFNTEFRHSLTGNKHISQYAVRASKDSGGQSREPSEKPVPKLTQNARLPPALQNAERSRPGLASSSTARTVRGGKRGAAQNQGGVRSLQTFFKNRKDFGNADRDDEAFN